MNKITAEEKKTMNKKNKMSSIENFFFLVILYLTNDLWYFILLLNDVVSLYKAIFISLFLVADTRLHLAVSVGTSVGR